jgi:hypothetical protein
MVIDSWRQARQQSFLTEARRLGVGQEKIAVLQRFADAQEQEPLNPREMRIQERAWQLIRGRGWPTESIRLFFLFSETLDHLARASAAPVTSSEASGPWLPKVVAATAVSIPRDFAVRFNEQDLTRITIHEMVHARAEALPQRQPDPDFSKHSGLHQLSEGVTEMIAEQIVAISQPMAAQAPGLIDIRERSAQLCHQAGLDLPAVERLAVAEVLDIIASNREQSLEQLGADFQRGAPFSSRPE